MRGDGRVFQRGNVWWVGYSLRGREYREPARDKSGKNATDAEQAQKFLRARLKQVHADEIGASPFVTPQTQRFKVSDLLAALKADFELRGKDSVQNLSHLKRADADFGHYAAIGLTAEKIDAYIERRLAQGDANASINHATQMLRQSFVLAIRRGTLNRAPYIRKLSEAASVRTGFVDPAEFKRLHDALPDDGLRDFCQWAYITGQRKGEVSRLTWDMLDGDTLRIPGSICKNGQGRTLPVTGELEEIFKRRKAARRVEENGTVRMAEFLFHRGDGRQILEFRKTWKTALKSAGLSGLLFHDLRRSAVRNSTRAGIPQVVSMQLSGHRTTAVWLRYNIVSSDDLREALQKTEAYREAEEKKQKVVAL